ncbi:MAG: hypothetical protein U0350_37950 [Caldilineaceae bacterium]
MDVKYRMKQPASEQLPPLEVQEEFSLLMSLSLDALLDRAEEHRFQTYLLQYPVLARQWRDWQLLDRQFTLTPAAEPAIGFVERFEARLAQQERRRLLWRNLLIGTLIILVWGGMLVGGTALAAYVLLYQGGWLVDLVHTVAYYGAALSKWLEATWTTLTDLLETPQAIGFGVCYVLIAGGLLAIWVRFLRHTTRESDLPASLNEPLGV